MGSMVAMSPDPRPATRLLLELEVPSRSRCCKRFEDVEDDEVKVADDGDELVTATGVMVTPPFSNINGSLDENCSPLPDDD